MHEFQPAPVSGLDGPSAPEPRKVLLVGATGVFGSRLAGMLAAMPGIDLILAARGRPALEHLHAALRARGGVARLSVRVFDRTHPEALAALRPWLVVDAAGPFQDSGYDLPRAALNAGAHYVDLADSRAFVAGFPAALDGEARAAGRLAVTGASSTPALSHAVLADLTEGWRDRDTIRVAISPGARAPRGLSVVVAILSYVGRPVTLFRDGRWQTAPGWSGLHRLAMPGLGRRWVSLCETPDLDLIPRHFAPRREAVFLAGLALAPMHLGLAALAWLVRGRILASLRPLARPLLTMAGLLAPFGSDRGGMIVEASGRDGAGWAIRGRWALWAEADAGPHTPAAPAAAMVRALLGDTPFPAGAQACTGLLTREAILRELAAFPIATRIDESLADDPALFRRLLGRRFEDLPLSLQTVHAGLAPAAFAGHAVARVGRHPVAAILRRLLGLPPSGACPATVSIRPYATGERWERRFGTARFTSRMVASARLGVFEERVGPLRLAFRLDPIPRGLLWRMEGWSLLGLPLPRGLAPRMRACSEAVGDRYRFRVAVAHPWTGLLFAYRGMLR